MQHFQKYEIAHSVQVGSATVINNKYTNFLNTVKPLINTPRKNTFLRCSLFYIKFPKLDYFLRYLKSRYFKNNVLWV